MTGAGIYVPIKLERKKRLKLNENIRLVIQCTYMAI